MTKTNAYRGVSGAQLYEEANHEGSGQHRASDASDLADRSSQTVEFLLWWKLIGFPPEGYNKQSG